MSQRYLVNLALIQGAWVELGLADLGQVVLCRVSLSLSPYCVYLNRGVYCTWVWLPGMRHLENVVQYQYN